MGIGPARPNRREGKPCLQRKLADPQNVNIQAESRARYIAAIRAFQEQDDPYPFVAFFCANLAEQLGEVLGLLSKGAFDGGMLDATGSGRSTIAAFWEKDGHQYATGSFMWPSGETSTIALVRP